MTEFDFTPVVKAKGNKLVGKMLLWCLPVVLLVGLWDRSWGFSLLQGLVIGAADTLILFRGINKALPYVEEPEKGLKVMKRYRWYRVIAASSVIIMLLKRGSGAVGAFSGLLLMHILLITQLILFAYRLNKEEREERSEKHGK